MRHHRDTGPPLGFPVVVRMFSRPAPDHPVRRRSGIVPEWMIRAVIRVGKSIAPGPVAATGIPISEALDVLVIAPSGTADLRLGYVVGTDRITVSSCWQPVSVVPAGRQDASKRWYTLDQHPTIRFEEPAHVIADGPTPAAGDVPRAEPERAPDQRRA